MPLKLYWIVLLLIATGLFSVMQTPYVAWNDFFYDHILPDDPHHFDEIIEEQMIEEGEGFQSASTDAVMPYILLLAGVGSFILIWPSLIVLIIGQLMRDRLITWGYVTR